MYGNLVRFFASVFVGFSILGPAVAQETEADEIVIDSVFDLVSECDLLASDPFDLNRLSDGVAQEDIVGTLAVIACESAIADDPENARDHFQLARSYLALDQKDLALAALIKAAQQEYAPAFGYLGDFYQLGLGVDVNLARAKEYYEFASQNGYEISAGQIEAITFDATKYASRLVGEIYSSGAGAKIGANSERSGRIERNYLFNFYQAFSSICGLEMPSNVMLKPYTLRYPTDYSFDQDEDILVIIQSEIGQRDAQYFADRHTCDGPISKVFKAQLIQFFSSKG